MGKILGPARGQLFPWLPRAAPPCEAGRTCCSRLSREGWLAQDTVFWKHCLYSAKGQRSLAQPCPGPVPSHASGFPCPVMTLAVSLPRCQPMQQRCSLAAMQCPHNTQEHARQRQASHKAGTVPTGSQNLASAGAMCPALESALGNSQIAYPFYCFHWGEGGEWPFVTFVWGFIGARTGLTLTI